MNTKPNYTLADNADNTHLTAGDVERIINWGKDNVLAALLKTQLADSAKKEIATELRNRTEATPDSILAGWSNL